MARGIEPAVSSSRALWKRMSLLVALACCVTTAKASARLGRATHPNSDQVRMPVRVSISETANTSFSEPIIQENFSIAPTGPIDDESHYGLNTTYVHDPRLTYFRRRPISPRARLLFTWFHFILPVVFFLFGLVYNNFCQPTPWVVVPSERVEFPSSLERTSEDSLLQFFSSGCPTYNRWGLSVAENITQSLVVVGVSKDDPNGFEIIQAELNRETDHPSLVPDRSSLALAEEIGHDAFDDDVESQRSSMRMRTPIVRAAPASGHYISLPLS